MASLLVERAFNKTLHLWATSKPWPDLTLQTSIGKDLYAGTDISSLSFLEKQWMKWYLWIGHPVVATGIMSLIVHETFFFGRAIPWMIVAKIRAFDKYKLQPSKIISAKDQWRCVRSVLWSHFTVSLGQVWGFHPVAEYFGMTTHSVPFPSWTTIAYQVAIFFVFEDFFHYWAHRALHTGILYKKIHKLHHEFSAPFGVAAEYAHPLEVLILGTGTIGGPLLWSFFSNGNCHLFTVYIWVALRLFQAIDAHSGYDFPWSLHNIIPFWAGAEHHDYHHEKFIGCYSTSFRWWDHLFGTDKAYKEYRKKQKMLKLSKSE
ncbi:methylsterol monooxygenase [Phakopsora pachyrhizi]|uniref:Methylsterol monooxygenase n=1 Tax=Phakopsora pachyrhizi TaxID=170000 RepID=A0AAV0BHE6_PHAPC|nr:methylsterol monooxygenase [Phakopsora pachyrhizi]